MRLRCPGCALACEIAAAPVLGARTVCARCRTVGVLEAGALGVRVRAATDAELTGGSAVARALRAIGVPRRRRGLAA